MRKDAFEPTNYWQRGKYVLEEQEAGVLVLTAKSREPFERYEVGYYYNGFDFQPGSHDFQEGKAPHVDLLNLDIENHDAILGFVNKWGLLGLWADPKYAKGIPGDWTELRQIKPIMPLGGYFDYTKPTMYMSEWYEHPHKQGPRRWQEPLEWFQKAVKEFQDLNQKLRQDENSFLGALWFNDKLKAVSPQMWWNDEQRRWVMSWRFSSLLSVMYLQLALDLIGGRLRKCQNRRCGKYYLEHEKKETKYCSIPCGGNSRSSKNRLKNKKRRLYSEFPHVAHEQIDACVEEMIRQGVTDIRNWRNKLKQEYSFG